MPYMVDDSTEARITYNVGATPADVFSVPFPIVNREDLVVRINGDIVTNWTLDVITRSDIGVITNSNVRLQAPVSNASITLERQSRLRQQWSITSTSNWRPREHSREIGRIWLALQDMARNVRRALRLPDRRAPMDPLEGQNRVLILDSDGAARAATAQEVEPILSPVFLPRSGGSMAGQITMPVPPTESNHVATKGYVDAAIGSSGGGGGGPYLPLSGGTLTGKLTIEYASAEESIKLNGANAPELSMRAHAAETGVRAAASLSVLGGSGADPACLDLFRVGAGESRLRVLSDDASNKAEVHRLSNSAGASGVSALAIPANHRVGVGTTAPQAKLHVAGTDAIIIPSGTTAQRPSAVTGMLRVNTTTGKLEYVNASGWTEAGAGSGGGSPAVMSQPRLELVSVGSGATLQPSQAWDQLAVENDAVREKNVIVRVIGTGDATVTLPDQADGVVVGTTFVIRNERTGQLTIAAKNADSTVNNAANVVCPWQNGVVLARCEEANTNNSGVKWVAHGHLSTPMQLSGIEVLGESTFAAEVKSGRRKIGAAITANTTLAEADIGTLRMVTGTSVTVTFPSSLRGSVELHFVNAGTFQFESQSGVSIPANTRVFAEAITVGSNTYRWMFRATPG